MSAINWPAIQKAIQNFFVLGSGLAANQVTWAFTGSTQVRPMVSLQISDVSQVSHDAADEELNVITFDDIVVVPTFSTSTFAATAHGRQTGDGPVNIESTGDVPTGTFVLTPYWVIVVDANHFQLAATFQDTGGKYEGNPITPLTFSDDGTGTIKVVQTDTTIQVGSEIKLTSSGLREVTVTMSCYGAEDSGISPVSTLVDVIAALTLYADQLDAAGVGVTDIGVAFLGGGVRLVPGRRGSILEPHAISDMTVYLGTELVAYIGAAESIGMAVVMQQVDGTPLDEIDLVITDPT